MSDTSILGQGAEQTPSNGGTASLQDEIRARYGARALAVLGLVERGESSSGGCCGGSCCDSTSCCDDAISGNLYSAEQLADVPGAASLASLGCGNPTALIDLHPGQTVLDLGSGGGIDVILSARRVGPTGKVYGVDMTDEMLALARHNAAGAGVSNVEFLKGQIEDVPLPDNAVDVVISNCVINLSGDKPRALREAFRLLRPGGQFAVSDIVVDGPVPAGLRSLMESWVGCVAGALERAAYEAALRVAGFADITIEPTRYYRVEDLGDPSLSAWLATLPPAERERLSHAFFSGFVRAKKPNDAIVGKPTTHCELL